MDKDNQELRRGQTVIIYKDSFDCVEIEGKAMLVKCHGAFLNDDRELWEVKFENDNEIENKKVLRWINLDNH